MPVSAEPGLVKRYSTPASFRVWSSSIPPVPVMVLRMVDLAVIDRSQWRTGPASRKPEQYSRAIAPGLVVAGRTRYPVGRPHELRFQSGRAGIRRRSTRFPARAPARDIPDRRDGRGLRIGRPFAIIPAGPGRPGLAVLDVAARLRRPGAAPDVQAAAFRGAGRGGGPLRPARRLRP